MIADLQATYSFFLRPVQIFKGYSRSSLRPDVIAGLTVAVILLPQAIAYALIADLPPQVGLYAAIVGAIVGALWGSSNHTAETESLVPAARPAAAAWYIRSTL